MITASKNCVRLTRPRAHSQYPTGAYNWMLGGVQRSKQQAAMPGSRGIDKPVGGIGNLMLKLTIQVILVYIHKHYVQSETCHACGKKLKLSVLANFQALLHFTVIKGKHKISGKDLMTLFEYNKITWDIFKLSGITNTGFCRLFFLSSQKNKSQYIRAIKVLIKSFRSLFYGPFELSRRFIHTVNVLFQD